MLKGSDKGIEIEVVPGTLDKAYVVGIDVSFSGKRAIAYNSNRECYSIVGGHGEDGESADVAALRELKEETGIISALYKLRPVDWHLRHPKGMCAQPFKFNSLQKPTPQQGDEITDFVFLTNRELVNFMNENYFEPFSQKYYEVALRSECSLGM